MDATERAVRAAVYRGFIEAGLPPGEAALAAAAGVTPDAARAALRSLADAHLLALRPGTTEVWMAHPFSAIPTPYRVATRRGPRWANCAWDALGIAALLGEDTACAVACADGCGTVVDLSVVGCMPADGCARVHFAVPARRFWDDIGFT